MRSERVKLLLTNKCHWPLAVKPISYHGRRKRIPQCAVDVVLYEVRSVLFPSGSLSSSNVTTHKRTSHATFS